MVGIYQLQLHQVLCLALEQALSSTSTQLFTAATEAAVPCDIGGARPFRNITWEGQGWFLLQ